MWQQLAPAFRMTLLLTVLTGMIYPGVVTGLCQVLFNKQAHGSLITQNGQVVGSRLLGQNFAKPEYFHPRPSAAGNDGYDPTASSGSNLGPTNQKLYDRMKTAAAQFRKENPYVHRRNPGRCPHCFGERPRSRDQCRQRGGAGGPCRRRPQGVT